jgi:hypothetical protein
VDGGSLNTTSLRRFTRFLSKTEHVDKSKFAQKISEAEDIAETNTKHPSNYNTDETEEVQVQTALGLVGNVDEVPVALQIAKQFNNHNMKMHKSNNSNLSDICLSRKKENFCSGM